MSFDGKPPGEGQSGRQLAGLRILDGRTKSALQLRAMIMTNAIRRCRRLMAFCQSVIILQAGGACLLQDSQASDGFAGIVVQEFVLNRTVDAFAFLLDQLLFRLGI
jgi:hypothetical protein